jgi:hypothetical protein
VKGSVLIKGLAGCQPFYDPFSQDIFLISMKKVSMMIHSPVDHRFGQMYFCGLLRQDFQILLNVLGDIPRRVSIRHAIWIRAFVICREEVCISLRFKIADEPANMWHASLS